MRFDPSIVTVKQSSTGSQINNNNNNNNNNNTYIAPISILLFSSALKNKNIKKIGTK